MCRSTPFVFLSLALAASAPARAADGDFSRKIAPLLTRFCVDCHGEDGFEGQVSLTRMSAESSVAASYKNWGKVATMLEGKKMPPKDSEQPSDAERRQLVELIRGELTRVAKELAGQPGQVVMRRLTSAEYAHTIEDLTGLDLDLERDFTSDAVGGEGFTNIGIAQFVHDSTLERYLEAAKKVATHAVVGAGPVQFFPDPGKTGFELSAITRINNIYRQNGFRASAGEGAVPYGLDAYPKAFYAAWCYRHRDALGLGQITLAALAAKEKLSVRFVEHIWSVMSNPTPSYPSREIVSKWQDFPAPAAAGGDEAAIRAACGKLYADLSALQGRFGESSGDIEESPLLHERAFTASQTQVFRLPLARPFGGMGNGQQAGGVAPQAPPAFTLTVALTDPASQEKPVVLWRNPRVRSRAADGTETEQPLKGLVSAEDAERLSFGRHPAGVAIGEGDFATTGAVSVNFSLPNPERGRTAELVIDAQIDAEHGEDCVVKCSIARAGAGFRRRPVTVTLADPQKPAFRAWLKGMIQFARELPQVSQREPALSDRDPIPEPFDNTYNGRERDYFHYKVKYNRDDQFLVEHILDDETRRRLDIAWRDLVGSFEYHDAFLRFVVEKYRLDLGGRGIADLDDDRIDQLPEEPRRFVRQLADDYRNTRRTMAAAESGHLSDLLAFAELAWRRPLIEPEKQRLQAYYTGLRGEAKLDHTEAIRASLVRVLVAPDFLYRAERPASATGVSSLTGWELASRLSYFLWSSPPDAELRRAAESGELARTDGLARQAARMLRDPKARRFATEFFGQWFGFYQFDRYRGVDPDRFPEFNDRLKNALYEEAISFFDHIVREDRPVDEILFADYTFLDRDLAKHYGIESPDVPAKGLARIAGFEKQRRGGLLGLGAVLTATSAPLRTSPVKRGDWILRRIVGTPVPPPPADAGSIPGDDVLADGQTVRQRLEAHRQNPTCATCHTRIDPLGFALEHFDSLGRWRDEYRDGLKIDPSGTLSDGTHISGHEELRAYLKSQGSQFHRTLCTKLIGYALGRVESVSDAMLIDDMVGGLARDGRFSTLIVKIVTSPQFRTIEGAGAPGRETSALSTPQSGTKP